MEGAAAPRGDRKRDYVLTKAKLADESWRLNNLYWVQDEHGTKLPFQQREPQRWYYENRWYLDIIAKARQLGFSTEIAVEMLDTCIFHTNTSAGIIDFTLEDAKKKLAKARYAYEHMPDSVKAKVPLVKDNEEELWFANDSRIEVGTTHRGGTLQFLHVSEFGQIAVKKPDTAVEIKTGAFKAVHAGNRIVVESTAHGTAGEFRDMVTEALNREKSGLPPSPLSWRVHFFPWWRHKDYRLQSNLVVVSLEMREYFAELRGKWGIRLDAMQEAWYAHQYKDLGPDKCREEYPSTIDELFFASVEGAYFKREMSKARAEKRVGHPVPFDNTRGVFTSLDIGVDGGMVLIFWQTDGVKFRVIDCLEDEDHTGSVQLYASWLFEKARDRGFRYTKHYVPHDMSHREWGSNAQSRYDIAKGLISSAPIEVVPQIMDKADSIEIARRMIGNTWFCEEHAKRVVDCLDNYQKKWNKTVQQWTSEPLKNGYDHGADAFQNGACGYTPDAEIRPPRSGRARSRSAGAWGA